MPKSKHERLSPWREKIHEIIFEADTRAGKVFDIALIIVIVASVLLVILESVESYRIKYDALFSTAEWVLTILFTIEFVLRLYCVRSPLKYATSTFGIIDIMALLPSYLSMFLSSGISGFIVIRALRLLRIFRIFKLGHSMKQASIIVAALKGSRVKISIFLFFILILVTIIGSLMYVVEDSFDNIPMGIYWAVVTLTTVGYGDIYPVTNIGKFLAATVMILGYAVIAVPTGIVSSEFISANESAKTNTQACPNCASEGHDDDAKYCKYCGVDLYFDRE